MKLSFVIPCYRSERTIEKVIAEIRETLQTRPEYDWEAVLVSDGSPDNVYEVIKRLSSGDSRIRGMELARNFGQHGALMAGYRESTGELIVSLDDDGQTPVNEVFKLIDKLNEGYDAVYADYRNGRRNILRRAGTRINKRMLEMLVGKPKHIVTNSYFVVRRFVLEVALNNYSPFVYFDGIIFKVTKHVACVEVEHRKRYEGTSGYGMKKLFALWLNGFTAFSVRPLEISAIVGALSAVVGFLYATVLVIRHLFRSITVEGYSSLMAGILIIGGIILMMLGILGEYVGRIYLSINRLPQYVIRARTWDKG